MFDVDLFPQRATANALTMNRRLALTGLAAVSLTACTTPPGPIVDTQAFIGRLRDLEQAAGGRLGAYIFDPATGAGFGWREGERFAHCSSFKMSLAAMMLLMADRGDVDLNEILRWTSQDLLPNSPVTSAHVETGLTIEALASGTLITSDNTAANVLLKRFGGPQTLTRFWRALGDDVSQLDRYETELNSTPPGTTWDTTTPKAMALTTAQLVHGNVLSAAHKIKLTTWMNEVKTGTQRIRAGFPSDWFSGDKTGTFWGKSKHTYVDLAFGGPVGMPPVIITGYFEPTRLADPSGPMDLVSLGVLAQLGRVGAAYLSGNGRL
jgi:beta-lactamase class A